MVNDSLHGSYKSRLESQGVSLSSPQTYSRCKYASSEGGMVHWKEEQMDKTKRPSNSVVHRLKDAQWNIITGWPRSQPTFFHPTPTPASASSIPYEFGLMFRVKLHLPRKLCKSEENNKSVPLSVRWFNYNQLTGHLFSPRCSMRI